jgi:hypothetical protein
MTCRCHCTEDVHLFDHSNTNGTLCQGHTKRLLVNSRTSLYAILQQHSETGFFHILRCLHFSDNMKQPDKPDSNYDNLENQNFL